MAALPGGVRLRLLGSGDADALATFERDNRAWFAASVPDRGDAWFADVPARLAETLARRDAGTDVAYVLVEPAGPIVGRLNLYDLAGGSADLGFRVAQAAAGRGLMTAAVREVCERARTDHGLTLLRAAARVENAASRAVLARAGFTPVGETVLSGRPGLTYVRDLLG